MTFARFNLRKNVANTVIAFALNMGLVFISYRLVILQGGLATLGLWSTLMAWVYLVRLGDVGMGSATTRFVALRDVATDARKLRVYVDTGLIANAVLYLGLSIGGYLVMNAQMGTILPPGSQESVRAEALSILPVMFAGFFLMSLSGLVMGALWGLHHGYLAARLSIAGTVLQLIMVVILVPRIGLGGLAWGLVAQHGAMALAGWLLAWRIIGIGPAIPLWISRRALREMLGYSLRVQAVNIANGLFEPLSKILISRIGGLHTLGLFELAYKSTSLPRNAVMAGSQATLPAMTELLSNNRDNATRLYHRVLRLVMLATGVVLGLVVLGAPVVSWLWLGRLDWLYWAFTACLAVGWWGNAVGAPAYNLGMASGKLRNNLVSAVLSLVIMAGGGVLLGSAVGAIGTALTVAFALIFGGVFIKYRNESELLRDC